MRITSSLSLIVIASMAVSSVSAAPITKKKAPTGPIYYGSERIRTEDWQWFQPKTPLASKRDYTFTGSLLKLGFKGQFTGGEYGFELGQTSLFNLPKHASLAAPIGTFGPGANYFANSGKTSASIWVRQAFVGLWSPSNPNDKLKLGRFDFNEGVETKPADATLNQLQLTRIQQRLIGTFGYSDIQRSFDGAQYVHSAKSYNITAFAAHPTQGVFTLLNDNNDLSDVNVGYAALTLPQKSKTEPQLARLFAIGYEDDRKGVVKTDNRSLAVRTADKDHIRIQTIGADYLRVFPASIGKTDLLLWGAEQFGNWGKQKQEAYAYDFEAGFQPAHVPMSPWLRAGYYVASGDNNANDGEHRTFFLVLPTPRIYARMPFFTQTNLHDAFIEATVKPNANTSIRADIHGLSLDKGSDLWYQGGGAFTGTGNFGYSGTPGGGHTDLATLTDVSIDYKIDLKTSVSLYYGYASPGKVIKTNYTGASGSMGYVELNRTF